MILGDIYIPVSTRIISSVICMNLVTSDDCYTSVCPPE